MDNGTFKAQQVKDCLARHGVQPLYSPPYAPSYNGSIEAGVGSLSVRAHYQAARHDRPGDWTCDDVEAARCQSNETARPHGTYSPVPDHAWSGRFTPTADERSRFVEHSANLTRQEYAHHGWLPMTTSLPHREQASLERIAIARTLIDRGYLMVRRRRIPPPISAWRAQKIS